MKSLEPGSAEIAKRRRGRVVLVAIVVVAAAAVAVPTGLKRWYARDFCPTEVTATGSSDGTAWDVARSTCDGGRIVWQLRIVPAKGVSTLVYEAEGGPVPLGWSQAGLSGEVRLAQPLASGETTLAVKIDVKGRPSKPIHVKQGTRVD